MAFNQREKILATGVGALLALFVGQSVVSSVRKSLDDKKQTVERLKSKREEQDLQILAGTLSQEKIKALVPRSLPKSEEKAIADYQEWLIGLGMESKIQDPTPRSLGEGSEKDPFKLYRFQLTGIGNIEQATQLLYGFYNKNYLHRITRFDIRPSTDPKTPELLTIALDCEVLALSAASDKQPAPGIGSPRLTKSIDDYKFAILERNLFSPANNPPGLEPKKSIDATVGIRLEHNVDAKDLDQTQKLTYETIGEVPKGLTLEKETGKLVWTSKEVGEYKVEVKATDSGIPSRSALQSLTIKVKEPPPPTAPPIQFDVASQATVTALISGSNGPEGWVESKTESKTYYLRKGDKLKLGGVEGQVIAVGQNYIELETNGRKWTVGLAENLADAYTRSQVD